MSVTTSSAGKEFVRSDDYMTKIFVESFDNDVKLDALITFRYLGGKLKAYCADTRTYLQFPRDLRSPHVSYIADIVKSKKTSGAIFYRAYPKSIRSLKTGAVVG